MVYWVREKWKEKGYMAVIHSAECCHCKNGTEPLPQKERDQEERWHGPFKSIKEAEKYAANKISDRIKRHRCCLV